MTSLNSFFIHLFHHVLAITTISSIVKCFKHFAPKYIFTTALTFINGIVFYCFIKDKFLLFRQTVIPFV